MAHLDGHVKPIHYLNFYSQLQAIFQNIKHNAPFFRLHLYNNCFQKVFSHMAASSGNGFGFYFSLSLKKMETIESAHHLTSLFFKTVAILILRSY